MVKEGAKEQQLYMRKKRIVSQITHAITEEKKEYMYKAEDKDIIDTIKDMFNIDFKQE